MCGGGGGGVWRYYSSDYVAGVGGGGGYVSILKGITTNPIQVSIGSGGRGNRDYSGNGEYEYLKIDATDGGTTSVKDPSTDYLIIQALGGKAAKAIGVSNKNPEWVPGTGNGSGSIYGNGSNGTVYKFGDSLLGLAGGGGGGAGRRQKGENPYKGGEPGGGDGSIGYEPYSMESLNKDPNLYRLAQNGRNGGGGGGGVENWTYGGASGETSWGADGGSGVCWVRVRR